MCSWYQIYTRIWCEDNVTHLKRLGTISLINHWLQTAVRVAKNFSSGFMKRTISSSECPLWIQFLTFALTFFLVELYEIERRSILKTLTQLLQQMEKSSLQSSLNPSLSKLPPQHYTYNFFFRFDLILEVIEKSDKSVDLDIQMINNCETELKLGLEIIVSYLMVCGHHRVDNGILPRLSSLIHLLLSSFIRVLNSEPGEFNSFCDETVQFTLWNGICVGYIKGLARDKEREREQLYCSIGV